MVENLTKFSNVPSMVHRQNKYIAAKSTQLLTQRDIVSMCLLKSNFQIANMMTAIASQKAFCPSPHETQQHTAKIWGKC